MNKKRTHILKTKVFDGQGSQTSATAGTYRQIRLSMIQEAKNFLRGKVASSNDTDHSSMTMSFSKGEPHLIMEHNGTKKELICEKI